jgi:hypothetical protein
MVSVGLGLFGDTKALRNNNNKGEDEEHERRKPKSDEKIL